MGRQMRLGTVLGVLLFFLAGAKAAECATRARLRAVPRPGVTALRVPPRMMALRPLAPFLSTWAARAPRLDGVARADEWGDAASLRLPHGTLRMQNNLTDLFLLIDMTGDTGNDPQQPDSPWGDYFWLVWDVNGDRNVTPGIDLLHGIYPGTNNLGVSEFVQPGAVTGLQTSASRMAVGFGPSPDSATPHRFWEIAVNLAEIGADAEAWADDPLDAHPLRMGLHVHSEQPRISDYLPQDLLNNFSRFYRILLALSPEVTGVGGPVFATVGVIPSTEIHNGYATTGSGYMLQVRDAPFGGTLNIFSHFPSLPPAAKYYQVLAREVGAADYTPLRLSWSNYRWETDRFVLRQIGPDSEDRYAIPPASEIWSLPNLLVRWPTAGLHDGLWELKLALFNAARSPIPDPPTGNHLELMLDNTPPRAVIHQITQGATPLSECAIVHLGPPPDGLRFTFTAWDYNGHLYNYHLVAHYGSNRTDPRGPIAADNYSRHIASPPLWNGVASLTVPAPPATWRAPYPCAYQFRLVVRDRATNGYNAVIHRVEYNEHLTVLMEGPPLFPLPTPGVAAPVGPPAITPMAAGPAAPGPGPVLRQPLRRITRPN